MGLPPELDVLVTVTNVLLPLSPYDITRAVSARRMKVLTAGMSSFVPALSDYEEQRVLSLEAEKRIRAMFPLGNIKTEGLSITRDRRIGCFIGCLTGCCEYELARTHRGEGGERCQSGDLLTRGDWPLASQRHRPSASSNRSSRTGSERCAALKRFKRNGWEYRG